MITQSNALPQQPIIVKYVQPYRNGIQSQNLTRHGIGYVLRGKKHVYYGDVRHEITRGELFYFGAGTHYTEDLPEKDKPFEQIVFYFAPDQITRILAHLSVSYGINVSNDHLCDNCRGTGHVAYPAWGSIRNFFASVNQYVREGYFVSDETAECMKMTELVYLVVTHPDCCLKRKMLDNIDVAKDNFEQVVHNHIFEDISAEELASKCNRSLTAFKKEFKRHFSEPPHKWFIRQRLLHSRLLLISTNKSVSEIGNECNFPNTSHFIKLFRKEYGTTPATYRLHQMETRDHVGQAVVKANAGATVHA